MNCCCTRLTIPTLCAILLLQQLTRLSFLFDSCLQPQQDIQLRRISHEILTIYFKAILQAKPANSVSLRCSQARNEIQLRITAHLYTIKLIFICCLRHWRFLLHQWCLGYLPCCVDTGESENVDNVLAEYEGARWETVIVSTDKSKCWVFHWWMNKCLIFSLYALYAMCLHICTTHLTNCTLKCSKPVYGIYRSLLCAELAMWHYIYTHCWLFVYIYMGISNLLLLLC